MKKWILLLAGAMLAAALTACGGQQAGQDAWTVEQGQAILESGAFSEELERMCQWLEQHVDYEVISIQRLVSVQMESALLAVEQLNRE